MHLITQAALRGFSHPSLCARRRFVAAHEAGGCAQRLRARRIRLITKAGLRGFSRPVPLRVPSLRRRSCGWRSRSGVLRGGRVVFRVAVDCSKFQSASLYKGRRFAFMPHCLKKSSTRKSVNVQVQRDRTHGFATRRRAKNENRAFYSVALSVMPLTSRYLLFFSFPGSAFAALFPQPTIHARRERRTA